MSAEHCPINPDAVAAREREWIRSCSSRWTLVGFYKGTERYEPAVPMQIALLSMPSKPEPEPRPLPDDNESVKAIRALELALKETP